MYLKRNRAGNPQTLGLGQTIVALEQRTSTRLVAEVRANLDALTEIRDNAVHYMNASPGLAKLVLEVGTAAVRNFIELARRWFNESLSSYNLFLMPIGFLSGSACATLVGLPNEEKKLLQYLGSLAASQGETSDFQTLMEVNVSLTRVRPSEGTLNVVIDNNDPAAIRITLTEEQVRGTYRWDYAELTGRLRERYRDFKANAEYHAIRKPLEADHRFAHVRQLDPSSPRSPQKRFYNPNIVAEFDAHYTVS
jgi:hypothetical protein